MVAAILSLAMAAGGVWTPAEGNPYEHKYGTATWYGAHCLHHQTYLGRRNTCSPYLSKAKGGRGGELVMYAAVAHYRLSTNHPYKVRVCRIGYNRCVVVIVRDFCQGATDAAKRPWTRNSRIIDLSPTAFSQLASLGRGVIYVRIDWDYGKVGDRKGGR
jgi:hypothetical protein